MRRRDLLAGGLALSVGSAVLSKLAWSQSAQLPQKIIDAHCHIFNGDDLPIVKFAEKVVIGSRPEFRKYATQYGNAIHFLIRFLAKWVRDGAPGAKNGPVTEMEFLDQIENGTAQPRTIDQIEDYEKQELTRLIESLKVLRIRGKKFRFEESLVSAYLPAVIVGYMHREAFPGRFNGKGPFDSSDHAFDPAEWSPSDFVADTLYEKAKLIGPDSPDLPLSRYLKWSLLFSRYRFELAAQMQQIHGTRLRLMTPALVDFSNWLDDRYDVKLAEQVAVMGRIARRPGSTRVHGFAPFDPLREALHRAGSRPGEAPLDLAKRAVREEGFVGVKLYPPIGFLPLNNRSLSYLDFPEHLGSFRRKLRGELDTILGELYGWCVEEQVPVLAHASDSNGAGPGYSGRANPDNWAAVLKNYPGLRLSVAHFGDFDEGFATKERPRPKIEDTWEWKMAKLAQDNPTVFIDMSYFRSALLAPDHAIRKEVVRMLREVKRNFRVLSQRLMFGTDWTMFGQEQLFTPINTGGRYADRVFDLLRQEIQFTEDEIDGVGFSNAAAFLGLALPESGKNNRARLRNFYDRHHLDAGWLSELTA